MREVVKGRKSKAKNQGEKPTGYRRLATDNFYSPHIPRRGAPQAPHGPGSNEAAERATPATANTDHSLSTRGLSQFLHTTSTAEDATILSNVVPQSRHLYSNSGMHALRIRI
jgi:hypothetical protein